MINKFFLQFSKKEAAGYLFGAVWSVLSLVVVNCASAYGQYNLMLVGMLLLFVGMAAFCLLEIKRRIMFFLFYLAMFLFLIGRILIPALQGSAWWNNYSVSANVFAVRAISYSMVAIAGGAVLTEIIVRLFNNKEKVSKVQKKHFVSHESLIFVLRIILLICMICFFIREADKLLFMRGKAYEDYFSLYHTRMPFFVTFPASCMQFFLCMFLALKPSKKESFLWLFVYILSAVPMLLIGVRNNIILNCLFAFVYYFLRDAIRGRQEKPWIGRVEKGIVICAIPVMVLFLGAYNYIRDDKAVTLSPVNLIVDFVYKQGTTYDTVLQGYVYQNQLPWRENQVYTLGAVTDSFFYSSLGKEIFDLEDIGEGNGLRQVYNGHTFTHAISYVVLGKYYIGGEGRGSSYIIENYLDWGYPGVVFFSMLIGVICSVIPQSFGKKWLWSTICLNIALNIFFTPRAESTAFITFIFSYRFWVCIAGCVFAAKLWELYFSKLKIFRKWVK
ncbi:hypothetical protein B5F07_00690 [Lachnoclostridium sp. An169]|uniref:O-antigen polysaccharide polymerase Wzy family protein n=1 Tax=Lachnoclostridium sp. An169 TaxID=1965569 RepID=UPI000B3AA5DD|nr:O-antigen polysaccharide polymerase Wzy family protein [Lachnoclostridium sp. An169]OUP86540.1 hypothetical protein B5F07_00690 [Lachnoclostridium sp. An169]HJA65278.1 O-antigen polysaccharide polymerase Wzy family protein [Candidatus Mediterraneibacter cottocaccae]